MELKKNLHAPGFLLIFYAFFGRNRWGSEFHDASFEYSEWSKVILLEMGLGWNFFRDLYGGMCA